MSFRFLQYKILLPFFLVLISVYSFSQQSVTSYRMLNYNNKNGLPSNETYDIIQDESGMMWVATDHGLVSYNGNDFKTYGYEDGVTDLTVFKFYPDAKKRLWVSTKNNKIFSIDHGKMTPYQHNSLIPNFNADYQIYYSVNEQKAYFGSNYLFDINDSGTYHMSDFYKQRVILTSDKDHQLYMTPSVLDLHIKIIDQTAIILQPGQLGADSAEILIEYNDEKITLKNTIKGKPRYARMKDSTQILAILGSSLIMIDITKKQLREVKFKSSLIYVYWDSIAQLIWVGTYHNGSYAVRPNGAIVEHLLDDLSVSAIYRDKEQNLWFTTLEKGVFLNPYPSLKKVTENQSATIRQLTLHKKTHYAFFSDGLFYFKSPDTTYFKRIKIKDIYNYIRVVADSTTGNIEQVKYWSKNLEGLSGYFEESEYHFENVANWQVDITGSAFFRYKNKHPSKAALTLKYQPNCALAHQKTIYLGNEFGLTQLDVETLKTIEHTFEKNTRIQCLTKYNNLLVMGSRGRGLKCFDLLTHELVPIQQQLPSLIIDDITVYNNQLWIACGNQLVIATIENNQLLISSAFNLGIGTIHKLAVNDSLILLANQNEVYELDHKIIRDNQSLQPPVLSIIKLSDFEQEFNLDQKEVTLTYENNNLIIGFQAIHYSSLGNIQNRYRILGLNDQWQYTNEEEISLLNLAPGSYEVEIASCNWNQQYGQSKIIQIKVQAPYWQTWWFRIVIGLIVLLVFYWIFRSENKKVQLKNLSNEYLLASLRSQMNPHFIFNSLNSIRSFIFTNEADKADDYLVKFSALTRNILQKSKLKCIDLYDEVSIITQYLDLEVMRADHSFEYQIDIDENVDLLTSVPVLITQPIVENAVLHGVLPLTERKGRIEINIKEIDNFLSILIIDNGVGIDIDQLNSKGDDHQSMGIELIKNRLKLLNSKSSYSVYPLKNDLQEVIGTKVTLKIYLD